MGRQARLEHSYGTHPSSENALKEAPARKVAFKKGGIVEGSTKEEKADKKQGVVPKSKKQGMIPKSKK